MDLLKGWQDWKASMKLHLSGTQLPSTLPQTQATMGQSSPLLLGSSPKPNQSQNLLSSIGDRICLDHIASVAPAQGRMVVASGRPLRHMDWETGKHFVLEPHGIRLESWQANPQVWWKHNSNIPLGTSDLVLEDGRLVAENIRFHRQRIPVSGWDTGDFDTAVIADLFDAGVLKASSVQVFFTADDMRRMFETQEHIIIPSSELIEWSLVTAPADREAVRLSLEGFGINNQLASLIIGEQIRENSRPVEVVSPAPQTENLMEIQDEMELDSEAVEAIALEAANALTASPDFIASIVAAVVANPAFAEALQNAVAAAAPVATPEPAVSVLADASPRVIKLRVPEKPLANGNHQAVTPVVAAPVTSNVPAQYLNPANKANARTRVLAQMTSKPRR